VRKWGHGCALSRKGMIGKACRWGEWGEMRLRNREYLEHSYGHAFGERGERRGRKKGEKEGGEMREDRRGGRGG
jgi:hypothetical protein